MRPIVVVFADG